MIRSSIVIGALALAASGALHLGGVALVPSEGVLTEGREVQQEVRLGNSFEDIAEGLQRAVEARDTAEKASPETLPEARERERTVAIAPNLMEPLTPLPSEQPLTLVEQPQTIAALTPLEALPSPVPVAPMALLKPQAEVLEALPEAQSEGLQVSRRPAMRPKAVEEAAKAQPKQKQAAKPQKAKLQKAAKAKPSIKKKAAKAGQNAPKQRAGSSGGKANATSSIRTKGDSKVRKAGNAKASNYPGLVARKIKRARKPRVRGRGRVVISFRVSASGSLASIRVARSSGNANIDRAALQYIRRAAPFPRPPQGAQRSFIQTVSFK